MNLLETKYCFRGSKEVQVTGGDHIRNNQTFFFKTGVTYANFNLEETKSFNLQTTVFDITVF